jgi:uncharacterized RDD family membrane protein YckC
MIVGTGAGFGRRLAALVYDAFLVVALLVLYTGAWVVLAHTRITGETVGVAVYLYRTGLLVIVVGYALLNWTRSGQTLGMRAWRLRVVSASGARLSWRACLLRFALGALAWAPAALGVLWLYVDRDRLAVQDRWSHSRVLRLARS